MQTTALSVLFAASVLAPLPAQTASFTTFGTGCAFQRQTLAIGNRGLPQLGTTFSITYSGPNMNSTLSIQPVLALGFASQNLPIPASLLPQQPPGCTGWIVPTSANAMPAGPGGLFVDHLDLAVPNAPQLLGLSFVAQWLAIVIQCGIVPPCNLEAVPTSDAAVLVVGT